MTPNQFLWLSVLVYAAAAVFGTGLGLLVAHTVRTLRQLREDDTEPGRRW